MMRINCPILEMVSGDGSLEELYLKLTENAKGEEN